MKYRDFRYIIPFLIQFLFFATPVVYSSTMINNSYMATLLALNPMAAPIDIFRASIEGESLNLGSDMISIVSSLVILVIGLVYFRKTEAYFADLA